jgi:23S rRNA (adenine2503-C2)-methyltransferase
LQPPVTCSPAGQPADTPAEKPHGLALSAADIAAFVKDSGEPAYRAGQIQDWIFKKRALSPADMSSLSKKLRDQLTAAFDWSLPEVDSAIAGADGSTKLLFRSKRGFIESVILRYENRTSLCVSSQVGCKLACSFCQTGKLGFMRHLSAAEIIAQFAVANSMVKDEGRAISHIVFMGMGEPLDNFEPVMTAVNRFTGAEYYGLSRKNVTISTSGIVPRILELPSRTNAALAVSLHAATDDLRSELMPINRKWNLAQLKDALLHFQKTTGDKITLEYILIRDKNCSIRDAKALIKFIHGLRVKVNLIPFNSHPGLDYQRPDDEDIRAFQKYLSERSVPAPVRYSKGLDVSAACGQLAAKQIDMLKMVPARKSLIVPEAPLV